MELEHAEARVRGEEDAVVVARLEAVGRAEGRRLVDSFRVAPVDDDGVQNRVLVRVAAVGVDVDHDDLEGLAEAHEVPRAVVAVEDVVVLLPALVERDDVEDRALEQVAAELEEGVLHKYGVVGVDVPDEEDLLAAVAAAVLRVVVRRLEHGADVRRRVLEGLVEAARVRVVEAAELAREGPERVELAGGLVLVHADGVDVAVEPVEVVDGPVLAGVDVELAHAVGVLVLRDEHLQRQHVAIAVEGVDGVVVPVVGDAPRQQRRDAPREPRHAAAAPSRRAAPRAAAAALRARRNRRRRAARRQRDAHKTSGSPKVSNGILE